MRLSSFLLFASLCISPQTIFAGEVRCGDGKIEFSASNARFIDGDGVDNGSVYGGGQRIVAIAQCGSGVVTAFSGKGVYFSPTCYAIGSSKSPSKRIYFGDQTVVDATTVQRGAEVILEFSPGGGRYKTRNCEEAGVHRVN